MLPMVADQVDIYEEYADFLASLDPERVLKYQISEKKQTRLKVLLSKNQGTGLSLDEQAEMEHYFTIERIVRLAKVYALERLAA